MWRTKVNIYFEYKCLIFLIPGTWNRIRRKAKKVEKNFSNFLPTFLFFYLRVCLCVSFSSAADNKQRKCEKKNHINAITGQIWNESNHQAQNSYRAIRTIRRM